MKPDASAKRTAPSDTSQCTSPALDSAECSCMVAEGKAEVKGVRVHYCQTMSIDIDQLRLLPTECSLVVQAAKAIAGLYESKNPRPI